VITLTLAAAGETAPYHIGEGLLGRISELLGPTLRGRQAFVVTDTTVGPLYGFDVAERLAAPCLELPAGEEQKRWPSVERIVRWLLAHEVERSALLVAVGGGVAANSRLRRRLTEACEKHGLTAFVPPVALCTDNAAMVGLAARHLEPIPWPRYLSLDAHAAEPALSGPRGRR